MGVRLWRIVCETEVLIASEGEPDDYSIKEAANDETCENPFAADVCCVSEIRKLSQIPKEWLDTIPHGDAGDCTSREIVEQSIMERQDAAMKAPMPNQISLPLE